MFLTRRPTLRQIEEFIRQSKTLPLSYQPIGAARETLKGFKTDESTAVIGHGRPTFERAIQALKIWKQFELGWLELYPRGANTAVGTDVAVLVHHLGFWSLNGCRIVYSIGDETTKERGFAYGTLTNHSESGEEIFEISLNDREEVIYRIRAASKPSAMLARAGYPYTRLLQARFRRDSTQALKSAIARRNLL